MERRATTYEVDDGVAVVTLNRPDRLNAWTARMEAEYRAALEDADADPDVRVAVVTGAGRGFCAGADTQALTGIVETGRYGSRQVAGVGSDSEQPAASEASIGAATHPRSIRADFEHGFSYPYGLRKPLIAAINGPAAGVGFVLACFADLRFAAAGAKLTTSFGRLGLPAEHGVAWVLPRLVGLARAADLLFSSRVVLAEEAAELGLVNKVLPPDELLPFTLDYARAIAREISPRSLATMKAQLWGGLFEPLGVAAAEAEQLMKDMVAGPDFAEGVAAFTERRPPKFS